MGHMTITMPILGVILMLSLDKHICIQNLVTSFSHLRDMIGVSKYNILM